MDAKINTELLKKRIRRKYKNGSRFAQATGMSRQYMHRILAGEVGLSLARAMQFAELLDVPVTDLIVKEPAAISAAPAGKRSQAKVVAPGAGQ